MMDFQKKDGDKPAEGAPKINIPRPGIEIAGGRLEADAFKGPDGKRAYGARFTKNFYAKGGKVKSASARADGCAKRGKTRGKMV
jgi:hypothetical protein